MKFKRILSILICILMLLSSCTKEPVLPTVTDVTEGTDELATSEPVTELPSEISLSGYKVIRSAKASKTVIEGAVNLKKKLDALTDNVSIGDDWHKSDEEIPEKALEILVGSTNRPESLEIEEELLSGDFAIKYFPESGRIVICGGSDAATIKAVDHFLEFCLKEGMIDYTLSFFSAGQYAVTKCLLEGESIENYSIIIPDSANDDEVYAAELISNCVREKTGIALNTVKLSRAEGGKAIIISSSDTHSDGVYTIGTDNGNILLSGYGGLVVKAARDMLEKLFPKGESEVSLTLGSVRQIEFLRASYPALTDFGTKPIALADQLNASIAVYDIASEEASLKYEFKPQKTNGFSLNGYGNRIDEARLRYSEMWGTYIMLFTSSSGYVGIASYPEEKCVWEAELKGTSPHSIEYLPCGLVAVASSGGSDTSNGFIRVYSTKNKTDNRYAEAKLTSAHAVLWDETREILWAMGSTEIVAYEIGTDPDSPTMKKIASYGCSNMKGGHDLSAIPGNDDQVWVGGSIVRIFDKTTGKLIDSYAGAEHINAGSVKCICSFPDGTIARTVATKVYADHNTDRFKLFTVSGNNAEAKEYVFEGRAFYKARSFNAEYN